ncbi:uncharacterized protein CBL_04914 [Carabus blaptoides fortunei]
MSRKQQIKYTKLFINNEFVDSVSKRKFPTLNPATEEKITDVAEADKADVNLAVLAAKGALRRGSEWRKLDASERGKLMLKLTELMERDLDILAELETLDNGKPLRDSKLDMQYAIDTLRYFAGWCDKIQGKTIPADGNLLAMTKMEPVGIVGQIIPWNYPVLMLSWKWGPALAAGCAVLLKPAEQTPLSALHMAALSKEAGFPNGVINVLPGFGPTAGAAMVKNMDINKIAFTGSTEVGRKIMEMAAQTNLKRISLELGGKSPLVVMNDADLDKAVEIAQNAVFANQGQNCCAASRTFVQADIHDKFVRKSVELAKARQVGDPFAEDTDQGAQIDQEMLDKICRLIESGKAEGAVLETGGRRKGKKGIFIEPAVFSNVRDDMRIAREEIFGPVQCILKFKTLEEVLDRANDTQFGLAAGILTKNMDNAMLFAQNVKAGSVWINTYNAIVPQAPFGGFKMSGMGRELGQDALKEYLEIKTIAVNMPHMQ